MFRLKYSCPFGGKLYPLFIVIGTVFLLSIRALMREWEVSRYYAVLSGVIAAELLVCFAEAQMPLWEPLDDAVRLAAADYAARPFTGAELISALVFLICCPLSFWSATAKLRPFTIFICLFCAAVCFGSILRRTFWREPDDSAVFIRVPVSHMYDVSLTIGHFGYSNNYTATSSFLVFYLPDGRYVLRARRGSGLAHELWIIQCRGRVIWLPVTEQTPID